MSLRVIEIFDSLQGEGYWSGVPMTFVRLAGCNAPRLGLDCVRWCDTPASWEITAGEDLAANEVLNRVTLPRLCVTGGEPLLQVDGVAALVSAAHDRGLRVHVETNGTVDSAGDFDWVVVSPKPPKFIVTRSWHGRIDELKLVVDDELQASTVERVAAEHPGAIVVLQPEYGDGPDEPRGRSAAERAVAMVMEHPDWRLSVQLHKFLGIR